MDNKPILYVNGIKINWQEYVEYFSIKMIERINLKYKQEGRIWVFLSHNYIFDINNFDYSNLWCVDMFESERQRKYSQPSHQYFFDDIEMPKKEIDYKIFIREYKINKILNEN